MTPKHAPKPKRPAVYARISVEREESVSIVAQVDLAKKEAARRGWPEPVVYSDHGISGSKRGIARPARDRLEADLASGAVDAVLVKSVDRLARSVLDFMRITTTAKDAGASVVVIEAGLDTSTPIGSMTLGVLANFAEFEAETIAQRVRTARGELRRQGRVAGGRVPYGLVSIRNPSGPGFVLAIDEEAALVVRRMAAEILGGRSFRAVALGLTADGVPAPSGAEVWDVSAVKRILTNPLVAGLRLDDQGSPVRDEITGRRLVNPATAVLDLATFDAIAALPPGRSPGRKRFDERPLLDEVAVCGSCGRPLRRLVGSKGDVSLRCGGASRGSCKEPASITEAALVDFVLGEIRDSLGDVERTETVEVDGSGEISEDLALVRSEIAQVAASFATAKASEIPDLAATLARLRDEETRILDEAKGRTLRVVRSLGETYGQALDRGDESTREIVRSLLRRVTVARAGRGRRVPVAERVAVDWTAIPD